MPAKFQSDGLHLTARLLQYVRDKTVVESPAQIALREATAQMPQGRMMISPEQGHLMCWLLRLMQARHVVEIGVFTGYSATWLARGLASGGRIIACDISQEWMDKARSAWADDGIADVIESRVGPAAQTLKALLDEGRGNTVDAIFIDADKTGYATYYELGLALLRPGGILLFDNMLWSGDVADPDNQEPSTVALRNLAEAIGSDERVHATFLTDGDGLVAVLKPWDAGGSS